MPLDNAFYIGQPDSCAFKILLTMETLEESEQFVRILHVETDPVVLHVKDFFISKSPFSPLTKRGARGFSDSILSLSRPFLSLR